MKNLVPDAVKTRPGHPGRGVVARRALAWTAAFAVVVATPALFGVSISEAAKTTGKIAVTILQNTSGLSSSSNLEVGLPTVTTTTSETDAAVEVDPDADAETAQATRSLLNASRNLARPAVFSVTGAPNQAFAVSVPSTSPTISGSGAGAGTNVVFSGFSHNAGVTPAIGGDGKAMFAVGATVSFNSADPLGSPEGASTGEQGDEDELSEDEGDGLIKTEDQVSEDQTKTPSVDLSLSDTDTLLTSSGTSGADIETALRENSPFSFSYDPRFLNVLVSYN